jgi:hypothetical protein
MYRMLFMIFLAVFVLLKSCQQQQGVDLVPVVPSGAPNNVTGFCRPPNVAVRIQNLGTRAATSGASVQIDFPNGPSTPQAVGGIAPLEVFLRKSHSLFQQTVSILTAALR